MFEMDEETEKIDFAHNPFSMPSGDFTDPLAVKAQQWDLVCNGYELASGGIRNHLPDLLLKAFEIVGYDKQQVQEKFGALYQALTFGALPHGGMAASVDRIVMLLTEQENLREIALFPMNQQGVDLMMNFSQCFGTSSTKRITFKESFMKKLFEFNKSIHKKYDEQLNLYMMLT